MTVALSILGVALFVALSILAASMMAREAGKSEAKREALENDIEKSIKAKSARDHERARINADASRLRDDDGFRRD